MKENILPALNIKALSLRTASKRDVTLDCLQDAYMTHVTSVTHGTEDR